MSKSYREGLPVSPQEFVDQLMRLRRGSIDRRQFLGLTGLGMATAVMARELGIAGSACRRKSRRPHVDRHLAELP